MGYNREKGHETLYVVRELGKKRVWFAEQSPEGLSGSAPEMVGPADSGGDDADLPQDDLDVERWFNRPKSHERRIHGHRHAEAPACQRAALHRRTVMRKARSKKNRPLLLAGVPAREARDSAKTK